MEREFTFSHETNATVNTPICTPNALQESHRKNFSLSPPKPPCRRLFCLQASAIRKDENIPLDGMKTPTISSLPCLVLDSVPRKTCYLRPRHQNVQLFHEGFHLKPLPVSNLRKSFKSLPSETIPSHQNRVSRSLSLLLGPHISSREMKRLCKKTKRPSDLPEGRIHRPCSKFVLQPRCQTHQCSREHPGGDSEHSFTSRTCYISSRRSSCGSAAPLPSHIMLPDVK
jgi:hypothetical protein